MIEVLTILLDHPANIQDIQWNTMQVITLIGGVLGVAGSFWANRVAIQELKTAKAALKRTTEKENQERKEEITELRDLMNKRVDAANGKIKDLEKGIGKKLDVIQKEITGIVFH